MLGVGDVLVAVLLLLAILCSLGVVFVRRGRKGPSAIDPVCGCSHHKAYHRSGTGPCAWQVKVAEGQATSYPFATIYRRAPCACQTFVSKSGASSLPPAAPQPPRPGDYDPLYTRFLQWLADHPDEIPPGA